MKCEVSEECRLVWFQVEELKKHYGLRFVTSSLEKKAEAGIISANLDADSTRPRTAPASCTATSSRAT